MAKKKIKLDTEHGFIGDQPKYKKKVTPYIEPPSITQYRYDRDMSLIKLYPELTDELTERWKDYVPIVKTESNGQILLL